MRCFDGFLYRVLPGRTAGADSRAVNPDAESFCFQLFFDSQHRRFVAATVAQKYLLHNDSASEDAIILFKKTYFIIAIEPPEEN